MEYEKRLQQRLTSPVLTSADVLEGLIDNYVTTNAKAHGTDDPAYLKQLDDYMRNYFREQLGRLGINPSYPDLEALRKIQAVIDNHLFKQSLPDALVSVHKRHVTDLFEKASPSAPAKPPPAQPAPTPRSAPIPRAPVGAPQGSFEISEADASPEAIHFDELPSLTGIHASVDEHEAAQAAARKASLSSTMPAIPVRVGSSVPPVAQRRTRPDHLAVNKGKGSMTITWEGVEGVGGYHVYARVTRARQFLRLNQTKLDKCAYEWTRPPSGDYVIMISVLDDKGDETDFSAGLTVNIPENL
ncbi:MAG: hypothetical protein GMKNLPBB_02956 [Myxococcota bacterium]|nr:hypothetical protein [Myxococcota bacterium]